MVTNEPPRELVVRVLRLGVAGLGRAFMLMLPTLAGDRRVSLVAAADPRREARDRFAHEFGGRAYDTVEALCADPDVEVVYIATPHALHERHAMIAAAAGKHILVEKPMALDTRACRSMIDQARAAGVTLVVGHSHSFDAPYRRARALIVSGQFGAVRMITAINYTDFLYRPRRPEELDSEHGGGVVLNQAAHHVDVVRRLAGTPVASVRAAVGDWDPGRPAQGAYTAFLQFTGGAVASLVYSGYGRFDTDELCGWVGESGQPKEPGDYGVARARLAGAATPQDETALKEARSYGAQAGLSPAPPHRFHHHFGFLVVSCERGELRPVPDGVMVYGNEARWFDALEPPTVPRQEVVDELYDGVVHGRSPIHSGEWGMATVEVCLAMIRSAQEGREIALRDGAASPP
ncbi:Gfo/Idh/MocA family protein [Reyranella sp. CPCC 100927]|uniref:Gfo/Idh/MocA family oxidoreductase n=1 Tax=Reyranella sp. CPCC 100927 TaxID=2599616 RepID=UPI001C49B4C2|nr:Gfo/Idh/MocA family oxidoreductase [Reyranella sp. CPCC 100927]